VLNRDIYGLQWKTFFRILVMEIGVMETNRRYMCTKYSTSPRYSSGVIETVPELHKFTLLAHAG